MPVGERDLLREIVLDPSFLFTSRVTRFGRPIGIDRHAPA
jgi:hypothetical protein